MSLQAFVSRLMLRYTFKRRLSKNPTVEYVRMMNTVAEAGFRMKTSMPDIKIESAAFGGVAVELLSGENADASRAILYIHGGAWITGSPQTHRSITRRLARLTGFPVFAVDYRLAPEYPWPAALDDCMNVWEALSERGLLPQNVAVAGDSAGGKLAAVVSQLAARDGGPRPVFQLLIYPVTDADFETASYRDNADGYMLTRDGMQWFWNHYVPDAGGRRDAYAAPLRAADLSGLPPATVQTAEFDPLRDEGEAYAKRLQDAGVATTLTRYDGQIHGFAAMFEIFDAGKRALEESSAALRLSLS